MQKPRTDPSGRLCFLDLFRGAFALFMLEGHTFRALLDPSYKSGVIFGCHEILHNLTGPGFLFASGLAFSLATITRWESYRSWNAKLARRLLRFFSLLIVGYMLHLTYFSLRRTLSEGTVDQLLSLLSMDILQCIAISGLLLQLLVMLVRGERSFFRVTLGGLIGVSLASAWIWRASQAAPFWLGTNLSVKWGSMFPLFPYIGFYLAGAAWGYLFVQARQRAAERQFLITTRRYSAWLVLGSLAASVLPMPRIYSDFWSTGPAFFYLRVGILALLVGFFRMAEHQIAPLLHVLALIGRESLVVYTAHLMILHGSALNPNRNLLKLLGGNLGLAQVTAVLFLMAGAMACLAWIWNRFKQEHNWKAAGLQLSLAGYLVYSFVSG